MNPLALLERAVADVEAAAATEAVRGLGSPVLDELLLAARLEQALQVFLLDRLAAAQADGRCEGFASLAGWLTGAAGVSGPHARRLVALATELDSGTVDATREAVRAQRITVDQAAVITRGVRGLAPEDRAVVEATLLEGARTLDVADLVKVAQHARILTTARDRADEVWAAQQAARSLDIADLPEGQAWMEGLLDPECHALLRTLADSLGKRQGPDDERTASQRRHDALKEALQAACDAGTLGEHAGQRPHLQILVDATAPGPLLGRLDHGGILPTPVVERICCDPEVTLTVVGSPDGTDGPDLLSHLLSLLPPALGGLRRDVLDQGFTTRFASPAQLRALRARDGGCLGCGAPAWRCSAHHVIYWTHGGPTDLDNLVLLCPRDHTLVHEGKAELVRVEGRWTLVRLGRAERRRRPEAA